MGGFVGSLRKGEGHHSLLFLRLFLSAFLISFPGRGELLTGSQSGGERVISLEMLGHSSAGTA